MPYPTAPSQVTDIRIEDNVFSNEGSDQVRGAIDLGMDPGAGHAQVTDVTIARNRFVHYPGDQSVVKLAVGGASSLIQDVTIRANAFSESRTPVELVPHAGRAREDATGSRIIGTRIVGNTFTNDFQPISIIGGLGTADSSASGDLVEDTLISENQFSGNQHPAIVLTGGFVFDWSPIINATGNVIRNTQILNNVIDAGRIASGISIFGGMPGGTGNRVDGVRIVNNTLVRSSGYPGLDITANSSLGGTGNSVSGVAVLNTIFQGSGTDVSGDVKPDVRFSITSMPGFAGVNGNIAADPRFVDPARGDFRLRAGSPAVDAGTGEGAPATDLDDRARFDDPATPNRGAGAPPYVDIGAYEYGAPARPRLTVSVEELGGTGIVMSIPAGISCPTLCSASFDEKAAVRLTATADAGSRFLGWSGACSGLSGCSLTMDAAKSAAASFGVAPYTVSVTRVGEGQVTSAPAGIACPRRCAASFAPDSVLRLRAFPAKGFRFAGWSGGCTGTSRCMITVESDLRVRAVFRRR